MSRAPRAGRIAGLLRALSGAGATIAFALASATASVAGTPGVNGNLTVTAANTVLNLYDSVTASSSTTLTVTNIANLQNAALGNVVPGSVIMLYQAQGATITSPNDATYGTISAYNSAGFYQFVTVGSVSGNTITIAATCTPIAHTYATTTQAIRVPQYANLTVNAGASIVPTPWNGATGGVVALDVAGVASINGTIDASGDGFRGAAVFNANGSNFNKGITGYVFAGQTGANLATASGATKGESIAGTAATYDSLDVSRYGRGAPANGGGGGDGHNSGGGGGSNGDNGLGWTGQGIEDTAYDATYSNANGKNPSGAADPGYPAMKTGSGGGRGGYTYGLQGGGDDGKRPVGGLGGHPLTSTVTGANARVFFGGGGGAGDSNTDAGSGGSGGNGGGIVYLNAASVSGGGSLLSNGATGGSSVSYDAAGGGGGGGAIVVVAGNGSIGAAASGGAGGPEIMATNEAEGPGGGGGGGFIASSGATTIAGGNEGLTSSTAAFLNGFLPYGATLGASGQTTAAPPSALQPYCFTPVIGESKSATVVNNLDGTYAVTYLLGFQNYGDAPLGTLTATDNLSAVFGTAPFTIATAPSQTAASAGASTTPNAGFNGASATGVVTAGTLPIGGTASVSFTVKVTPPVGSQTYDNTSTVTASGVLAGTNANGVSTTDVSNNGTNADPAGLGMPNQTAENAVTPITLAGQPRVAKTVRNLTQNEGTGLTVDVAKPGDRLEYTLSFTNGSGGALTNFAFKDAIPPNTKFAAAACGPLTSSGATACTIAAPAVNATTGTVTWTLGGTFATGGVQTVTLDVIVL